MNLWKTKYPKSAMQTKRDTGDAIENAASDWLQAQGLIFLDRNFRCRGGEIDLIMREGAALVFVEVRLRNRDNFGSAAESVTITKQRRVIHAAQYYLATHKDATNMPCRFDVLAAKRVNTEIAWEWVRDAFCAG